MMQPIQEPRSKMRIVEVRRLATYFLFLVALWAWGSVPCAIGIETKAADDNRSLKPFVGVWQAECNDKKIFLVLTLRNESSGLGGTISVGNMRGNVDGGCEELVDPPAPEHAQQISDAKLQSDGTLSFKGAKNSNGKYNQFEMKLVGGNRAKLKFFGTPVERNPSEIVKQS